MKKEFCILFFFVSCTILGKKSLINVALAHFNHDSQILVKIAAKKQEQLKNLEQQYIQYKQNLIITSKLIKKIKTQITSAVNEEHGLLQEIYQILCNTIQVQQELISFLDTFIKEVEIFLKSLSSLQITTDYPVNNNAKQLNEKITNKQKLIDQLISQKNNLQAEHEKEKLQSIILSSANNEKINLSSLVEQLNSLKQKLNQLYIEKYNHKNSLIALHISKEKIDLSLWKKQAQINASSSSNRNTSSPVYTRLLHYVKNSSIISKAATLVGLVTSCGIYMRITKKKKQKSVKHNNQTQKSKKLKKEKTNPKQETKKTTPQQKNQKKVEQKEISPKISQENFSQYYGTIPPEIAAICEQLKTTDLPDKQSDKFLPHGLFLVGSGKTFLTKCLAEELRSPLHSIPFKLLFEGLLRDKDTLETIVQQLQEKAKQDHKKAIIIHIDQITILQDLLPKQGLLILQTLSMAIKRIKHVEKNEPRVIIICSLNNSLAQYEEFIESKGLKVVKIPLPDKKIRKKIINKNLKNKPSDQTVKYLIESTEKMSVSFFTKYHSAIKFY